MVDLAGTGQREAMKQLSWAEHRSEMYDSYMKEYPVSNARERLAEIIEEVQRSGDPIQLTKRGRVVAVLIDPDSFEKLSREAEDAFDRAALALSEDDDDFIPWDEVKSELGLA